MVGPLTHAVYTFGTGLLLITIPLAVSSVVPYLTVGFSRFSHSVLLQSNSVCVRLSVLRLCSVWASCLSKHLLWTNLNGAVFMFSSLSNHSPHFITSRQNTSIIHLHVNIELFTKSIIESWSPSHLGVSFCSQWSEVLLLKTTRGGRLLGMHIMEENNIC